MKAWEKMFLGISILIILISVAHFLLTKNSSDKGVDMQTYGNVNVTIGNETLPDSTISKAELEEFCIAMGNSASLKLEAYIKENNSNVIVCTQTVNGYYYTFEYDMSRFLLGRENKDWK